MSKLRLLAIGIISGASLIASATPGIAVAQDQEIIISGKLKIPKGYEAVKSYVKIGDLNLATDSGVKAMNKRVANAVNGLCPMPPGNSPDYEETNAKLCRDYAWASAKPQMDRAIQRASQGTSGRR